jgi:hypothetical protein
MRVPSKVPSKWIGVFQLYPDGGMWLQDVHDHWRLAPPIPDPPRANPARMLSPWLTAASMRLRGRSQKTPVGSKGVGAEVVGGVGAELVLGT